MLTWLLINKNEKKEAGRYSVWKGGEKLNYIIFEEGGRHKVIWTFNIRSQWSTKYAKPVGILLVS